MKFEESEIVAGALIGFDMIEGPMIKWFRQFQECEFNIDMESFLMNFYLGFKGGDENLQPVAMLYKHFYIVAFSRGLELCCLFMKPENMDDKLGKLNKIATELMVQMDEKLEAEPETEIVPEGQSYAEIKRIVVNLLNGQEISTPELRRYFKLSNSEIWRVMGQLENAHKVIRTQKVGRAQYWTAV